MIQWNRIEVPAGSKRPAQVASRAGDSAVIERGRGMLLVQRNRVFQFAGRRGGLLSADLNA